MIFGNTEKINKLEKEIEKIKQNLHEINNDKKVEDGDICVVYGMQDEKIILLNTENGKEFDIYVSTSDEIKDNLKKQEVYSNIHEISKKNLYNLDLGSKLIMKDGKFEVYDGEINVKDDDAWYKLDELYGNLRDDENKKFIVKDVTDEKVYLTYEDGGGYISRYKESYPYFKPGDIVKRINGKFTKE